MKEVSGASRTPEVLWDEDGDRAYIEGHPEEWIVRLSILNALVADLGEYREDAGPWAIKCLIERVWCRFPPAEPDAEAMVRCRRWQRGATRWTVVWPWRDPWQEFLEAERTRYGRTLPGGDSEVQP